MLHNLDNLLYKTQKLLGFWSNSHNIMLKFLSEEALYLEGDYRSHLR